MKFWWNRWRPAWRIKFNAGAYRINFDIHRAFGLWTWANALIFVVDLRLVERRLQSQPSLYANDGAMFEFSDPSPELPARAEPLESIRVLAGERPKPRDKLDGGASARKDLIKKEKI